MASLGGPNIVTDGLVLMLDAANTKSYVSGSTTWNDLSGNANNGILSGSTLPTFDSANNGSLVFNGTTSYVSLGNPSNIQFDKANPFTLCIWIKHTYSSPCNIFSKQQNISPNAGWGIGMNGAGTKLQSYIYNSTGRIVDFPSAYNDGTWYCITTTYDGSDSITGIKLYANGTNVAASVIANSTPGTLVSTTPLQISGRGGANNMWGGTVSQAQIYNRVLSADEVLQNYNATKTRFGL